MEGEGGRRGGASFLLIERQHRPRQECQRCGAAPQLLARHLRREAEEEVETAGGGGDGWNRKPNPRGDGAVGGSVLSYHTTTYL